MVMVMVNVNLYSAIVTKSLMRSNDIQVKFYGDRPR